MQPPVAIAETVAWIVVVSSALVFATSSFLGGSWSALSECRKRMSCHSQSCRTLNPPEHRGRPNCVRTWTIHPYCVRDGRTLTILHPLLSAGNLGQFVHPLLHPYWLRTLSVLSPPNLAKVNKIPYCPRTFYTKFRPYSIRSDPQQHQCVGVKRP